MFSIFVSLVLVDAHMQFQSHLLLRQAERADKAVVKQLRFLHILRSGAEHGGLRDLQARKKTDAEGNDGDDGQKPPE